MDLEDQVIDKKHKNQECNNSFDDVNKNYMKISQENKQLHEELKESQGYLDLYQDQCEQEIMQKDREIVKLQATLKFYAEKLNEFIKQTNQMAEKAKTLSYNDSVLLSQSEFITSLKDLKEVDDSDDSMNFKIPGEESVKSRKDPNNDSWNNISLTEIDLNIKMLKGEIESGKTNISTQKCKSNNMKSVRFNSDENQVKVQTKICTNLTYIESK